MSTYSVANLSGSVGKTTTVVTMGVQLASTGLREQFAAADAGAGQQFDDQPGQRIGVGAGGT